MEALRDLIADDEDPAVAAVLAHWGIGYIHPFFDGNGRTSRFIMNFLLVLGGFPWVVVRVEDRAEYLASLEVASVGHDFTPFAEFIKKSILG
jgi:Fic family protein